MSAIFFLVGEEETFFLIAATVDQTNLFVKLIAYQSGNLCKYNFVEVSGP
jgi:hypothetical protein